MAYLDCLNSLVALSNVDYPCFQDTRPAGYNVSDSGYSLTDSDFGCGEFLGACEIDGWTVLARALAMAIRNFKTDLSVTILNYYDSAVRPFQGFVGQLKSAGYQNPSLPFVGHIYKPYYQKGAKLVIKHFYAGLSIGDEYTIRIRSNDPTFTPPADVVGTVTTGVFTKITPPDPIELPFYTSAIDDLEYYVSIERNGAAVLYNTFSCCGNHPGYEGHFTVEGFQATSASGENKSSTGTGNGLVIDAYITCEELGWLCNLTELNGLSVRDLAARTIQERGAAIAIAELADGPTINLCNLYTLEQLQTKRNFLNAQYANNIQWIAQNLPKNATDCFTCKEGEAFHKINLLV